MINDNHLWFCIVIVVVGVLLGILRLVGHKSQSFQAVAHIYVGALLGAYFTNYDPFYLYTAVAISVVEVIAFLIFRKTPKS